MMISVEWEKKVRCFVDVIIEEGLVFEDKDILKINCFYYIFVK